jgi:hypothetical protein
MRFARHSLDKLRWPVAGKEDYHGFRCAECCETGDISEGESS